MFLEHQTLIQHNTKYLHLVSYTDRLTPATVRPTTDTIEVSVCIELGIKVTTFVGKHVYLGHRSRKGNRIALDKVRQNKSISLKFVRDENMHLRQHVYLFIYLCSMLMKYGMLRKN